MNNSLKTFLIILLSFILLFLVSCSNKDKTGGSDNGNVGIGADNGNINGGTSGGSSSGSGGSSSEGDSSGDSDSGGGSSGGSESGGSGEPDAGGGSSGDSGGESPAVVGGTTSDSTGSGVKFDLEGYWSVGQGTSYCITNGKLSMSKGYLPYEGKIPDSFNYPLSILATGTIDGETKTAVFTFYDAKIGAYYYNSYSGLNIGASEKNNSSSAGEGNSGSSGSAGGGVIYGKTGSGVKSDLEGNWQAGYDKFTITDGKLSMTNSSSSSSYHGYEGQIPDTFDYPLNIVLTGNVNGETKTAIFTFYNSTNGFCYYDSSIYVNNKVTAQKLSK